MNDELLTYAAVILIVIILLCAKKKVWEDYDDAPLGESLDLETPGHPFYDPIDSLFRNDPSGYGEVPVKRYLYRA